MLYAAIKRNVSLNSQWRTRRLWRAWTVLRCESREVQGIKKSCSWGADGREGACRWLDRVRLMSSNVVGHDRQQRQSWKDYGDCWEMLSQLNGMCALMNGQQERSRTIEYIDGAKDLGGPRREAIRLSWWTRTSQRVLEWRRVRTTTSRLCICERQGKGEVSKWKSDKCSEKGSWEYWMPNVGQSQLLNVCALIIMIYDQWSDMWSKNQRLDRRERLTVDLGSDQGTENLLGHH